MNELMLILDARAGNAEGPVWDFERRLLYWVDIPCGKVHIYNPSNREDKAINVGQSAGCVVMKKSGGLLVALQNGIYDLDPISGEMSLITDPERHIPNNRFNDGKCDPAGRLWAGTMAEDAKGAAGSLYVMEKDQRVNRVLTGIGISNGIAWSPDEKTMYYIDTPTMHIDAFDYNVKSGAISKRRTVVEVTEEMGHPDGMTIDVEGKLWVAMWGGWAVTRWDPFTGTLLGKIDVPAAKVSCCTFGGADLDELYITTAREKIPEDKLADQPCAGGIFKIKMEVKGLRSYKFDG
jgi:sugar lactone lactonase YvrE